jgi:Tol biopolymer transport system component
MGEVYRAHDPHLGRDIAIKVLPVAAASDEERRGRFEREARAVAALNHPNIVTIHAVEEAGGVPFFTMEYIEGRTLRDLIPEHGLPLDQLLKIAIPLTDAVSAAHQRGILHRDLKPANVMLTADGRVKVLDFGLAKLKEALAEQAGETRAATEATGEGRVLGTAAYMSPEQAEGKPLDARSDVFSLGVVLYEMATGQRPFKGDTNVSVISSILKDTPGSVTELRPELPRDLGKIVRHALNKDPEHRYQTAKDLRNDLEALKADLDSGELPASGARPALVARRRWPWWAWVALALGAGVLVAGGVFAARQLKVPPSVPVAPPFSDITMTRLTSDGNAGLAAAISPDGRYVAQAFIDQGQQGLRVRQVETSATVQVVSPADIAINGVTFTPDGNRLCYFTYPHGSGQASLYEVPVLGGTPRKLLEDIDSEVTFAPDGSRFAFVRGDPFKSSSVIVANADGTGERTLAVRKNPDQFVLANPAWSPDGKVIAAVAYVAGTPRMVLMALDPGASAARTIGSRQWDDVSGLCWLPGSAALLVTAADYRSSDQRQTWLVEYPAGTARRITSDLADYGRPSVSANGRTLAATREESRGSLWTGPTGQPQRAARIPSVPDTVAATPVRWTPDGRILYTASVGGNSDIWSVRPDGSAARQLTVSPGWDGRPSVAPDGRHVAFVSNRDGVYRIWRMDADGGQQAPLTAGPADYNPVVSGDGMSVYYVREDQPLEPLYRVPIAGGQPTLVSLPTGSAPHGKRTGVPPMFAPNTLSADGTLLLGRCWDDALARARLAVVGVDGRGGAPRLFDIPLPVRGFFSSAWMPDGRAFTFTKTTGGVPNLWRQPIDGGAQTQITHFTGGEALAAHAWSPDGKLLAMVRAVTSRDIVIIKDQRR